MLLVSKLAKNKNKKKVKVTILVKGQSSQKVTSWLSIRYIIKMWITINLDHTLQCQVSAICGSGRRNYQNTPAVITGKYILKNYLKNWKKTLVFFSSLLAKIYYSLWQVKFWNFSKKDSSIVLNIRVSVYNRVYFTV